MAPTVGRDPRLHQSPLRRGADSGAKKRRSVRAAAFALAAAALGACVSPEERQAARLEGAPPREPAPSGARRVGTIIDFHAPEAVRYDPERDVFYVSNIYLYGSVKDGNGFIVELDAANLGRGRVLAQGGRNGVTLHAPKGMAIAGDTLWVADIDVVRGFHRVTGAPLATVDFAAHSPTLLNDLDVGPDGALRVTDTGIVMSEKGTVFDTTGDRVFRVGPGHEISALVTARSFAKPNGIRWDSAGKRWLVVTFAPFSSGLFAMAEGDVRDTTRTPLATGRGKWDGLAVTPDGRALVSSWSDSTVYLVDRDGARPLVRRVPQPAALGFDTRRNRVAIPLVGAGRVEVWTVPGGE